MSTRFRIVSDLHIETHPGFLLDQGENEHESVLILAGDIFSFRCQQQDYMRDFLLDCSQRFQKVFYVLGNHEFYGGDINTAVQVFRDYVDSLGCSNVRIMNNEIAEIDGTKVIFSTMWSDANGEDYMHMFFSYKQMADYMDIMDGDYRLKPEKTVELHKEARTFIASELEKSAAQQQPCAVITHYSPTYNSLGSKFKNSPVNGFFHSNMDSLIVEYQPKLWVHGHTHDPKNYDMGATRILANPKGYSWVELRGGKRFRTYECERFNELLEAEV